MFNIVASLQKRDLLTFINENFVPPERMEFLPLTSKKTCSLWFILMPQFYFPLNEVVYTLKRVIFHLWPVLEPRNNYMKKNLTCNLSTKPFCQFSSQAHFFPHSQLEKENNVHSLCVQTYSWSIGLRGKTDLELYRSAVYNAIWQPPASYPWLPIAPSRTWNVAILNYDKL